MVRIFFPKICFSFFSISLSLILSLFKILVDNDFPEHQVKSYYYFQVGRWDLQFFNDQVIKFPDEKINEAIQQSVELLERKDFKNYNIIDLRMHGKIIVE